MKESIKESREKSKNQILSDIAEIYHLLERQNATITSLYEEKNLESKFPALTEILNEMDASEEMRFACVDRIVGLKEASLLNVLQKLGISEERSTQIRKKLLRVTRDFYRQKHEEILDFIQDNHLLTPFLREVLFSVHRIGQHFDTFFESWQKRLILGINKDLNERFGGDLSAILRELESSIEVSNEDFSAQGGFTHKGELSDRSYSVPVLRGRQYQAVSYAEFFAQEFQGLQEALVESLQRLEEIDTVCEELEQKDAHLEYFRALKNALLQRDCGHLLESWRLVDKAWMQISTPLQIGHPLEYYEDHFRKAVAPEWDLRIARIYEGKDLLEIETKREFSVSKESVLRFYKSFSATFPQTPFKDSIDQCVAQSLAQTQCYGGMPMLFYGAELNGLFSAQVVPNDEKVSQKYGKKIFYFPDRVRELSMAKPFMLLTSKTFPKDFLDFVRTLLFFRERDWHRVYEISTIGHEFGHILWVDSESELRLNESGVFKNIEEFKATMGGLVSYFVQENKTLLKEVIASVISRAVGLVAWKKEDEVLPYYCEGLIHLDVLFSAGVLRYRGDFESHALEISLDKESLESLQQVYTEVYRKLVLVYLNKQDARIFLDSFMQKDNKGCYEPTREQVRRFTEDYYAQYERIGQVKDPLTSQMWKQNHQQGQMQGQMNV